MADVGWSSSVVAPRSKLPNVCIQWYRTKLEGGLLDELQQRSDWKGFLQAGGFVAVLLGTAAAALVSWARHWPWWITASLVFLYGMEANFCINGVHELGHNTVFRTRALTVFFLRLIAFLGWLHPDMFFASHLRHHRYTLNYPLDQEVVLPVKLSFGEYLKFSVLNVQGFCEIFQQTLYAAINRFPTGHLGWSPEWEAITYPEDQRELRVPAVRWARLLLCGHALLAAVALLRGHWLVPVIFSFGPFYGGWLFFLCNSTQHVGMQGGRSDFRLNCRSIRLNPVLRFLYWQMNYHIEHHMYATVPCYNLWRLHEAIKHDLPEPPDGLVAAWREIITAVRKQADDPAWEAEVVLPVHGPGALTGVTAAGATASSPLLLGQRI